MNHFDGWDSCNSVTGTGKQHQLRPTLPLLRVGRILGQARPEISHLRCVNATVQIMGEMRADGVVGPDPVRFAKCLSCLGETAQGRMSGSHADVVLASNIRKVFGLRPGHAATS